MRNFWKQQAFTVWTAPFMWASRAIAQDTWRCPEGGVAFCGLTYPVCPGVYVIS